MIKQALMGEILHEADNTRKLFDIITDDVLTYKPNDFNWTIGELLAHVGELYYWFDSTLNMDVFNMAEYKYEKPDTTSIAALKARLEENIAFAIKQLENFDESKFMDMWTMKMGDQEVMPPMPRIVVMRGFLLNHLYHHRGEVIALLRVNGKPVPGLYGPTYEEMQAQMAQG
jgi:uncharacterized damage-inducible protein DinB